MVALFQRIQLTHRMTSDIQSQSVFSRAYAHTRLPKFVLHLKVILESAPALLNTSQIVTLFLKNRESLLKKKTWWSTNYNDPLDLPLFFQSWFIISSYKLLQQFSEYKFNVFNLKTWLIYYISIDLYMSFLPAEIY